MSLNIESMFAGESDSFELARAVKTYLVPLDSIQLNENNFYSVDDEGIRAIADSIADSGLIHPLSAMQEGNDIRLISGERRLRAMKLLKNEGIHYRFNGRDITGYAPLTYMQNVFGSREKLTIAAANASRDLTNEEVDRIKVAIDDLGIMVEGDLRRSVAMDIKTLQEIGCYRGIRHRKGLPVRGQKTKTNARTRKGPKRTVANKKK